MRGIRILMFFVAIAMAGFVAGCASVPAKLVEPGKVYSKKKYGVCFDVNDMKKLNRTCNIKIK